MTPPQLLNVLALVLAALVPSVAAGEPRATSIVYLNFEGGTLVSGPDDARIDTSQICSGEYPAYGVGNEEAIRQSVVHDWARWNIDFVTERPDAGDYTMAMIGPKQGCFDGAGGVAPKDCMNSNPNNIVFSFATVGDAIVESTVISQEVAHAYGLEHVENPGDIMYPTAGVGDPEFVDECTFITGGATCGEQHTIACGSFVEQNAVAELDAILGLAIPDTDSPLVAIVHPDDGDTFAPGAGFSVDVEASDGKSLAEVALWLDGVEQGVQSEPPFSWNAADLPEGSYTFEAIAKDGAGNETTSAPVTITIVADDGAATGESSGSSNDDDGDGDSSGDATEDSGSEGAYPGGDPADSDDTSAGCGCRAGTRESAATWGWLALVLLGRARRRARLGAVLGIVGCGAGDGEIPGTAAETHGEAATATSGGTLGASASTDDGSTSRGATLGDDNGIGTTGADASDEGAAESSTGELVMGEFVLVDSGVGATLRAVRFADDVRVWAVGDAGTMVTSPDAGESWTIAPVVTDGRLRSITFVDPTNGWAVGEGDALAPAVIFGHTLPGNGLESGTVLRTADGETWTKGWYTNANFELHCVRMASAQIGQLCDYGSDAHRDGDVIVTHDGGESWNQFRAYRALNDAFWIDESTAWAVGTRVSLDFTDPPRGLLADREARIIATTDGGMTWQTQASPVAADPGDQLFGVWFTDALVGVVVGDAGEIVRTTDGGATWIAAPAAVTTSLRSVVFVSESQGFVVGTAGTILQTTDGGESWSPFASPTGGDLLQIHAPPAIAPVAVGADGIIIRME